MARDSPHRGAGRRGEPGFRRAPRRVGHALSPTGSSSAARRRRMPNGASRDIATAAAQSLSARASHRGRPAANDRVETTSRKRRIFHLRGDRDHAGDNAVVHHYKDNRSRTGLPRRHHRRALSRDSQLDSHSPPSAAPLTGMTSPVELRAGGRGARQRLLFAGGSQHVDHPHHHRHAVRTQPADSSQGIMDGGRARLQRAGESVRKDAQKSDPPGNRNMLLKSAT